MTDSSDEQRTHMSGGARSRWWAAGVLMLATVLTAGMLTGAWLAGDDAGPGSRSASAGAGVPAEESVDAGFARDMQAHHAQAVRMSLMVRDATTDVEVRRLALDVLLTQQQQLGQMFAWLEGWGLSQVSASPMSWMTNDAAADGTTPGHDMAGMDDAGGAGGAGMTAMPGMASDADLRRLESARGKAAERLYLQLMVPHHRGAVQMARAALADAEQPAVRSMARKIATAQAAEIRLLRSMLAERGGPVSAP